METSKELKKRMKIHLNHMFEQHSGHEFDYLTGRCGCGASIGIWKCIKAIRQEFLVLQPDRLADPMPPCEYSEV